MADLGAQRDHGGAGGAGPGRIWKGLLLGGGDGR